MSDTKEHTAGSALSGLQEGLQRIVEAIARDGEAVGTPRVELERPREEKFGDFATNVALLLAPVLRSKPREVADLVAARAVNLPGVETVDVAGPGFINITMTDEWFLETLRGVLARGSKYGAGSAAGHGPILLEFVSANPTGPLVASSARHAAYGDSLARILRFVGHDVSTEFYVNDTGRQVELFGASMIARAAGQPVPEGGYEGEYVAHLAEELGIEAGDGTAEVGARGVAAMIQGMRDSLAGLGIQFDRYQSERELHETGFVERGLARVREAGQTYEEDGATFLRTTTWGDDKDRAIVRANGVPTYFAADVGYLEHKYARVGNDGLLLYVLGADHHGYIARLTGAAQALGHPAESCEVVILQMVSLVEGGEQKKMSKRRGDFVTAAELVARIGADATRYFMLQRSHDQSMDLDLDLAQDQSDKNPVYYVQYAHARLCSIRRRVAESGIDVDRAPDEVLVGGLPDDDELHLSERRLVKRLAEYPVLVAEAASKRQPHRVVHYSYELASDVSKFYRDCRVIGDDITEAVTMRRLATCDAARVVLASALGLVGVSAPEKM